MFVFIFDSLIILTVSIYYFQVEWMPYGSNPASVVPRTLYMGTICYHGVIEPYMPQRCLRQLGYRQVIPVPPIMPESACRPLEALSYDVKFGATSTKSSWSQFPALSLALERYHRNSISRPDAVDHAYMEWFRRCSHPFLRKGYCPQTRIPPRTATEEVLFLF